MSGAFSHGQDFCPLGVMLADDAGRSSRTGLKVPDREGAQVPSFDRNDDVFPDDAIVRNCRDKRHAHSVHSQSPSLKYSERFGITPSLLNKGNGDCWLTFVKAVPFLPTAPTVRQMVVLA